jgi:hypothetical protein
VVRHSTKQEVKVVSVCGVQCGGYSRPHEIQGAFCGGWEGGGGGSEGTAGKAVRLAVSLGVSLRDGWRGCDTCLDHGLMRKDGVVAFFTALLWLAVYPVTFFIQDCG